MFFPSTVTPSSVRLTPLPMLKYAASSPLAMVPPPMMVTSSFMIICPFIVSVAPLSIRTSFDMVWVSHVVSEDITVSSPAAKAVILPAGSMASTMHKLSSIARKRFGCFLVSI